MNLLNLSSKYECLEHIFIFNNLVEACDPFCSFFSLALFEQIDTIDLLELSLLKVCILSSKDHRQRSHTKYFQSEL